MAEKSLQELQQEDNERKCPECGSKNIEVEGDEMFCKKCGYVFD
jgi:transposase